MSVTFIQRSAAKQPGGSGTITLAAHNLAAAGDLQMLAVSTFASNSTAGPSGTGWTQLHLRANTYSRLTIYVRTLPAGEVAASITAPGFDYTNVELRTYRATSGEQFLLSGSGDGLVCAAVTAAANLVRCWASAQVNTSGGSTKNLVGPTVAGVSVVSATASQNFPGEGPGNAFDFDPGTVWTCTAGPTGWVQAQLSSAIVATSYKISGRSGWDGRNPSAWTVQGSNDGSTWTTLDTRSGQSTAGNTFYSFTFSNSTAYSYYRFNITANQGDSSVCNLTEFQLPGVGVTTPVLLNAPASTSYNWYDGGLFGDDPVTNGPAGTSTAVHTGGGEPVSPQWANVLIQATGLTGLSVAGLTSIPADGGASISWNALGGATGYEYRIDGGAPVTVSTTSATLTGLVNGTTYTVEVRAKNATSTGNWTAVSVKPSQYYDDLIMAANPIFYASCQETAGAVATDLSPTAQNGAYVGGVIVNDSTDPATPGTLGRHVRLDGSSGHLALPSATAMGFAPATNGFTVEGWFYIRSWTSWARIFDFANALNTGDIYFAGDGSGTMTLYAGGGTWSSARWDVPGWRHVAITVTPSGTGTVYVNNNVWATGATGAQVDRARQYMYVGRSTFTADPYLPASFTRLAVYNKVLTSAQIKARYVFPFSGLTRDMLNDTPLALWTYGEGSGARAEDYGATAAMTLNGGALRNQDPVAAITTPSTLFDGVDDYGEASTPALNNMTGPWQVEAFVVPTSSWANLINSPIATNVYNGSGIPLVLGMGIDQVTTGVLQVGFYNNGWRVATYPASNLSVNVPYHIVGIWDGTTIRLRVNDNEVATNVPAVGPSANSSNGFRAMRRWDIANYVPGRLSHLAIYNSVLPAARTTSHYITATNYTVIPTAVPITTITSINSGLVVRWGSGLRVQTFEYRVNGGAPVAMGTAHIATIAGLVNGTTYTVEVRGVNGAGPGDWTAASATPRPTTLYDDFNRADSTTVPGPPTQGGPYTAVAGTWGISNGALYAPSNTAEGMLTFPGLVDLDFTFTMSALGTNSGVMFRYVDANNTWLLQVLNTQMSLWRRTGGSWQQQGNIYNKAPAAGDVIRLLVVGRVILAYRNGAEVLTAEDHYANVATSTMGFRFSSDTTSRLDEAILQAGVLPAIGGDLASSDPLTSSPAYGQGHLYKGRDTKLADQGAVA